MLQGGEKMKAFIVLCILVVSCCQHIPTCGDGNKSFVGEIAYPPTTEVDGIVLVFQTENDSLLVAVERDGTELVFARKNLLGEWLKVASNIVWDEACYSATHQVVEIEVKIASCKGSLAVIVIADHFEMMTNGYYQKGQKKAAPETLGI